MGSYLIDHDQISLEHIPCVHCMHGIANSPWCIKQFISRQPWIRTNVHDTYLIKVYGDLLFITTLACIWARACIVETAHCIAVIHKLAWLVYNASCSFIFNHLHVSAVKPVIQLLQIQEVHPGPHSSAWNFCCFYLFFIPVLYRPSFTSRTPNKDQKIEQLFYFLLIQVP